tara:strand:- start:284 stop:1273 length:990 start_codon:yes stop_codon:yes gene_type:complete
VSRKRFYHHVNEGKSFSDSDNLALTEEGARILNDEYQGRRTASVLPDGRLTVTPKSAEMDEDPRQQILSLLMARQSEVEALRGNSMQVDIKMTPDEKYKQNILYEIIGRGLLHPDALQVAARGFRDPSKVSTDDLSAKFIEDAFQAGKGYDDRDGAAFTNQHIESGHTDDYNLFPDQGHNIDNIGLQSRIVNKVTADSAKGNSAINPKYKSVVDMSNKIIDMQRGLAKTNYKDTVYTDDGDSDIYGSALDDLIGELRSKESRLAATDAMPVMKALEKRADAINMLSRVQSPDQITTSDQGKAVNIFAEEVHLGKAINGNGNGNGKGKNY